MGLIRQQDWPSQWMFQAHKPQEPRATATADPGLARLASYLVRNEVGGGRWPVAAGLDALVWRSGPIPRHKCGIKKNPLKSKLLPKPTGSGVSVFSQQPAVRSRPPPTSHKATPPAPLGHPASACPLRLAAEVTAGCGAYPGESSAQVSESVRPPAAAAAAAAPPAVPSLALTLLPSFCCCRRG
jgi:hypothetical protein